MCTISLRRYITQSSSVDLKLDLGVSLGTHSTPLFLSGHHKGSLGSGNLLCRQGLKVPEDQPMDYSCAESMLGRYVYIHEEGSPHVRLCEVAVFVNSK